MNIDMRRHLVALLVLSISASGARGSEPQTSAKNAVSPSKAATKPGDALKLADVAFRAGYAAFERGDLAAARKSFEQAVHAAPKIAAAHAALGAVLIAMDEPKKAVLELETAQKLGANDRPTLLNLCVAYANTRNYAGTISVYRRIEAGAEAGIPLPPDAAIAVATALSETGEAAASEDVLRKALSAAISAGEDNARLHDALGSILAQRRDYIDAEAEFRKTLELEESAVAHYHLGLLQLATNRPEEAISDLKHAHELDPASVAYVVDLSKALLASRRDTDAVDLLQGAISKNATNATPQLKYQLALALQSAGESKKAMPFFAEAVQAMPQNPQVLTNAALCYVQLGDAKTAVPLYLRALMLAPNDATVHQNLGVAYLQQADLEHAVEEFRTGLKIEPENPQLHYDLGLALKLKDDLAAAVPEFERAATLDPTLPDPPYTLGILYMQQGQFEKSAASLERVTQLRPDNGDAWATLGSVYQQMQQPEKAVPALRQAIALLPRQPSPHINLAAILAAQGHREEAAAERKIGAELTRVAVNRQKADFGLDSGNLLMRRGQIAEAIVQFGNAVEADPGYAAPHKALAAALDRAGRKTEAVEERKKAATLEAATGPPSQ